MGNSQSHRGRVALRAAQLLLVLAAGGLWAASRLPWLVIRSFDGLGQPRQATVSGASWSTGLVPLAVLALTAAVAVVAVRGWMLWLLAVLMAAASFAAGYLAISLWVGEDVVARGAAIADVSVVSLLGGTRHYAGAVVTLISALCMLCGAALLMRPAPSDRAETKYVAPGTRRSLTRRARGGAATPALSERMIWDALDDGCDVTEDPTDEGR